MYRKILVSERDFSVDEESTLLMAQAHGVGAICSFVGYVRDFNETSTVQAIFLEHYPAMTEKALAGIVAEAEQRWSLKGVTVIHRIGELRSCEQIVLTLVASQHRADAFAACEFLMDYLKQRAPFWKKEIGPEGGVWVESKASDQSRAERWDLPDKSP